MAKSKLRGRTRLSARGRMFLVSGVVLFVAAFALGNRTILLAALLLLILIGVAMISVRMRSLSLQAKREFHPAVVEAGSTVTATLAIGNLSRRGSPASLWRDILPWDPGTTMPEYLPSLTAYRERYSKAGNRVRVSYELVPPRRGIFTVGPLEVETGDPFGLVTGSVVIAGTDELVVTPRIVELPGNGLAYDAGDGTSTVVQRASSGSEDDLMTREYRSGDALRRVHWRASARHGELMVRQEEPRTRPEARLVIDTRGDGYADAIPELDELAPESASFEWVVSLVASIGLHLDRNGYAVTVVETAAPQLVQPGQFAGADDGASPFLDSLASVQLVRDDIAAHAGASSAQGTTSGVAPIFAILAEPSPVTVDWIIQQRKPFERATVILLGEHGDREPFENAGFTCLRASLDDDPAEVWAAALKLAPQAGDARVN